MSTSITYEYTTVIFSLHVIPYPGVDHLFELLVQTWKALFLFPVSYVALHLWFWLLSTEDRLFASCCSISGRHSLFFHVMAYFVDSSALHTSFSCRTPLLSNLGPPVHLCGSFFAVVNSDMPLWICRLWNLRIADFQDGHLLAFNTKLDLGPK